MFNFKLCVIWSACSSLHCVPQVVLVSLETFRSARWILKAFIPSEPNAYSGVPCYERLLSWSHWVIRCCLWWEACCAVCLHFSFLYIYLCALSFSKAGWSLYHMFRQQDEGTLYQCGSTHDIVMICEQMCYCTVVTNVWW